MTPFCRLCGTPHSEDRPCHIASLSPDPNTESLRMAALLRGLDERSAARLKYAHRKAARDRRMERLKVRVT